MASPTFQRVNRTDVDGVPVLWADAPGETTFALQFRVGRADERAADGGLTHLVEHLAMNPLGQPRYDHNAFVGGLRTVFFASGSMTQVQGFVGSVAGALAALRLDRFEKERDVLKREAAGRSPGVVESHLQYRFGTAGHGLVAYPEFGLSRLTAQDVDVWARRAFVRGNAMAFITGSPPADLRLPLLDGERLPVPPLAPEPTVTLPAHMGTETDGVGIGALVRRQPGAVTFLAIYHRRLRQRLRLERGLLYDVLADYEPLGADWAAVFVGGECESAHAQEVADIAIAELERVANGEVTQDEIDDETEDFGRSLQDPTGVAGWLDAMVFDILVGMPERGPTERYEEQRSTTPEQVAQRATEARETLILMADIEKHPADVVPYPMMSPTSVDGREVKPLLSVLGFGPKERLVIGPDGATVRTPDGSFATVRYDDCVILERPSDDDIVMWGRDGTRLWVPSAYWRGGEAVLAEIQAAVPSDIVVRDTFSHDYIDD